MENEGSPTKLWCLCLKPHSNRFMISCDLCQYWYHGSCVGITKKRAAVPGPWKCSRCVQLEIVVVKPLKDFLKDLDTKISEDGPKMQAMKEKSKSLEDLNRKLNEQVIELTATLSDLTIRTKELEECNRALSGQIEDISRKSSVLANKSNDLERQKKELNDLVSHMTKSMSNLKRERKDLEENKRNLMMQLEELQKQLDTKSLLVSQESSKTTNKRKCLSLSKSSSFKKRLSSQGSQQSKIKKLKTYIDDDDE